MMWLLPSSFLYYYVCRSSASFFSWLFKFFITCLNNPFLIHFHSVIVCSLEGATRHFSYFIQDFIKNDPSKYTIMIII